MTDSFGTTSYTHDYLSRLTSVTNPDNKTISYEYDRNGNRTQLTDPADNVTTYTYNDDGQLETVTAPAGVTTYHYDSLGRQIRVDYPNGTYTLYGYNNLRNFLTTIINRSSQGEISTYSYGYDAVGNKICGGEPYIYNVEYTYDDIYQLESETRTGTNPYTITYQYDNVGNRTQMVKNTVTTTYTYNNNNQLLTETAQGVTVTYSYDKNGNLLSKTGGGSTTIYTWDWRNLLLSVTESGGTTVYEYDGDGTRLSKTQAGVKTKYINDVALPLVQVLMETNNAGAVQAIYNYGQGLISMNRAGVNSYYHYDGLGSTRQLTDSSETVVASYTYDGYGNLIASSGSANNAYGFTGEQQFTEADNLVFLRARYYDPRVGRFISKDPRLSPEYYTKFQSRVGINAMRSILQSLLMKPQDLNPYVYTINNPVNLTDPTGGCGGGTNINLECFLGCLNDLPPPEDCDDADRLTCETCAGECHNDCLEMCQPKPACFNACKMAVDATATACTGANRDFGEDEE
jgi:RHS repeat-associated protein